MNEQEITDKINQLLKDNDAQIILQPIVKAKDEAASLELAKEIEELITEQGYSYSVGSAIIPSMSGEVMEVRALPQIKLIKTSNEPNNSGSKE